MSAKNAPLRRHRFEPARLVLGLALIGIAVAHLVRATGGGEVPLPVRLALLPAALLAAATVAVATFVVRRARGKKPASGEQSAAPLGPAGREHAAQGERAAAGQRQGGEAQ
ncbi:hypothetical protein [Streptomyces litchfieldiae]|uniref:Integral membrane protein n=1 Tax=Streptomyces litchfieldiae TaxID=3075543 RepID=A0ABU2MY22_9ACTN|nr:hypothetical protein [Streptomyces sp. DSM 44938]MDT0346168.1 hypothetical protein [Streptomyces sp. DSM 44938]